MVCVLMARECWASAPLALWKSEAEVFGVKNVVVKASA